MGVDLKLLPVTHGDFSGSDGWVLAHTVIVLDRRRELWGLVREVKCRLVPSGKLSGYFARRRDGEFEYGVMDRDSYDSPLGWARAADLAECLARFNATDTGAPLNVAAQAFLAALPPDWPVVLFWH